MGLFVGSSVLEMSKLASRITSASVGVSAVLAIAGHFLGPLWQSFVFTPLTTLLLVLIVFGNWLKQRRILTLWIAVGLVFSVCGDVLLLWPERYFGAGLAAFLCTHIAYLMAFTSEAKFPAKFRIWMLYLLSAAGLSAFLWRTVPDGLRMPVMFYSLFLSTMAAQAMGRWMTLRNKTSQLAAIGALLFMTSDTLLAIERFRAHIPASAVLVLGTYFAGQWLIASATSEAKPE